MLDTGGTTFWKGQPSQLFLLHGSAGLLSLAEHQRMETGVCLGARRCEESVSVNGRITLEAARNSHSERHVGTESHKDSGCGIFHFYLLLTQGRDASLFQSLCPSSLFPHPSPLPQAYIVEAL